MADTVTPAAAGTAQASLEQLVQLAGLPAAVGDQAPVAQAAEAGEAVMAAGAATAPSASAAAARKFRLRIDPSFLFVCRAVPGNGAHYPWC